MAVINAHEVLVEMNELDKRIEKERAVIIEHKKKIKYSQDEIERIIEELFICRMKLAQCAC